MPNIPKFARMAFLLFSYRNPLPTRTCGYLFQFYTKVDLQNSEGLRGYFFKKTKFDFSIIAASM